MWRKSAFFYVCVTLTRSRFFDNLSSGMIFFSWLSDFSYFSLIFFPKSVGQSDQVKNGPFRKGADVFSYFISYWESSL
jgi:hypothetical protein